MVGGKMSSLDVSKLKSTLQVTVNSLAKEGSVSSAVVIEAVRKADPDLVKRASRYLEDAMMQRLLGQLAARRPNEDHQNDLFGGYSGLHQFIGVETETHGERIREWKPLAKATLRELSNWLSVVRKTAGTRRQRNPGMAKLLRDLQKATAGEFDVTVEAALAIKHAMMAKKAAS